MHIKPMKNLKAVKLIIRGKVQQVGYRAAVYGAISDQLPTVTGYVKNLGNGDVEMLVYAEAYEMKKVIEIAYLGSIRCKVESVEVLEVQALDNTYENFLILS